MFLFKPAAFLFTAVVAGVLLAIASLQTNFPTGWIGAVALIAWAFIARRRWMRAEATSGLEPGAPERILWLRLAGNSLILGHLVAAMLLVRDDLRLGHGNTLAYDTWTMVLAQCVAALAFHRDERERDERHEAFLASGVRTGYAALAVGLVVLLALLAFTPPDWRSALSHFVLANVLIALLLASYGVMLLVQLVAYAKDTREARAAEQSAP